MLSLHHFKCWWMTNLQDFSPPLIYKAQHTGSSLSKCTFLPIYSVLGGTTPLRLIDLIQYPPLRSCYKSFSGSSWPLRSSPLSLSGSLMVYCFPSRTVVDSSSWNIPSTLIYAYILYQWLLLRGMHFSQPSPLLPAAIAFTLRGPSQRRLSLWASISFPWWTGLSSFSRLTGHIICFPSRARISA